MIFEANRLWTFKQSVPVFQAIKELSIAAYVEQGRIEDALYAYEKKNAAEAILMLGRFKDGKRSFSQGIISMDKWSSIKQQIGSSLLQRDE